jgi:anti-anti-sigma factor
MPDTLVLPDSVLGRAEAPSSFSCSWTQSGAELAWVRLAGELELDTVSELARTLRLAQRRAQMVVLDLRALTFTHTAGVRAIVDAGISAVQAGARLILLRGPPDVDRMFTLTESAGDVQIVDLDPAQPPVQVLLQLAQEELPR